MKIKLLSMTLALASGMAAAQPYVVIGDGRGDHPYTWMRPDGSVLNKGVSDAAGRAVVVREPGRTDYVLEMLWGRFRAQVADDCWTRPPEAFHACVRWGPREDSAFQREQQARDDQERLAHERYMKERIAWVDRSVDRARQPRILLETLEDQRAWMTTPAAAADMQRFECVRLNLKKPDAAAQALFDQARGLRGREASLAYARAAAAGHWRAAARLASGLLQEEDNEGSGAVVAWLLDRKIPAGYNKLADLLGGGSRYGDTVMSLSDSLRWRAALLGDPVAQAAMATYFARIDRPALAEDLRACAQSQNPEIR